ncbi:MAG: hypothetical protein HY286_15115 [Planctomycetes bacterium]|nr:hypothetical protein [Planctomycetota bacterium]
MIPRLAFIGLFAASCAVGSIGLGARHTQEQEPAAQGSGTRDDVMRRDVETMRRVLDRELASERQDKQKASKRIYYSLASASNSEAYHVPGNGFIYIAHVDAVLAGSAKDDKNEKDGAKKEPSLWDEVRAEVDGQVSLGRVKATYHFDPKQADDVKERAIRAMGKYAANMTQLKYNELVTLILKGGSGRMVALRAKDAPDKNIADSEKDAAEDVALMSDSIAFAFDGGGSPTTMTLSATRGDCAAFGEGKLNYESFASKVNVSQSVGGGRKGQYSFWSNGVPDVPSRK